MDIFLLLPKELLTFIFTLLPVKYLKKLYYDKLTYTHFKMPISLTNEFWINKAQLDFGVSVDEFKLNKHKTGFRRYIQILSREGICKYSFVELPTPLYILRATKLDNPKLIIGKKLILTSITKRYIVDKSGPKMMKYFVDNFDYNPVNSHIYNDNEESIAIFRGTKINDADLLRCKLLAKNKDEIIPLLKKIPIFNKDNYFDIRLVFETLSIQEILEVVNDSLIMYHPFGDILSMYINRMIDNNHTCRYESTLAIEIKLLIWAKTNRLCCIFSQFKHDPSTLKGIFILVPFLTKDDIKKIIIESDDLSQLNILRLLIYYPTLLYDCNFLINYINGDDISEYLIYYKDKLENCRQLMKIAKELGYNLSFKHFDSQEMIDMQEN